MKDTEHGGLLRILALTNRELTGLSGMSFLNLAVSSDEIVKLCVSLAIFVIAFFTFSYQNDGIKIFSPTV